MSKNLFQHKSAQAGAPTTPLGILVASIGKALNKTGSITDSKFARMAMSMESIDAVEFTELTSAQETLNTAMESCIRDAGMTKNFHSYQRDAAVLASMMAGDLTATRNETTMPEVKAEANMIVIRPVGGDMFDKRIALEAFDEKETRNATMYSIAYNMNASRQDEFGEVWFPTIVVTPDQNGLMMSIRLLQVMKEVRAGIDGNPNDFGFRNIINAVVDASILQNDLIKIIPVLRDESKHLFVDETLVAPRNIEIDNGIVITTAPLAMDKKLSLIGISQTPATLETGLMDHTDSVDTSVVLQNLYLKVGADVVQFNTERFPYSPFHYAVTGDYRRMDLNFSTSDLRLNEDSKRVDLTPLVDLKAIVDNKFSVRLAANVTGNVNLQTAETKLWASSVEVAAIFNAAGEKVALDTGIGKTIADLFADAKLFGYDLVAQRTNLNRRQRGQMLNQNFQYQLYQVPLRSPMTITRPTNIGELNDATDLAALITATHIRTSNAAVTELLSAAKFLRETYDKGDTAETQAATLGVARHLVKAYYKYMKIDVSKDIDSLTSNDRYSDAQATMINKLRDVVYNMHRDSNYQAAANALAGGIAQKTRVLIGTDPVIARFLFTQGDTRTLGEGFEHIVVTTLDSRMIGKMFVSFGVADQAEGTLNPMHFGNMAWKPEMTYIMPVYRNGANIKEITVMPAYLHIVNLPILAEFDVEGLSKVMQEKVALAVNNTVVVPTP